MSKLVEKLQAETQSFRAVYLEEIENWSRREFDVAKERSSWGTVEWCEYLGVEARHVQHRCFKEIQIWFPDNFYNTKLSRVYDREESKVRRITQMGVDKYVAKEQKNAEIHFQNSLLKLADRITKKGLNEKSLSVMSAHVHVNLEITITDGSKTVRAFTIIASGEVQRPHYRYLIK